MHARILETISRWSALLALPLVAIALAAGGLDVAIGAVAGAALAIVNLRILAWVVSVLARTGERAGPRLSLVLVTKTGFVLMMASVLVRIFDPTGLILGVSVLVLGVIAGVVHAQRAGWLDEGSAIPAGAAAGAERN